MTEPDVALARRVYTATVSAQGGRMGTVTSSDGTLTLSLGKPGSGKGTNPEQLLAAAWSACLQSTLEAAAGREGVVLTGSTVTVSVSLGRTASEHWGLAADIVVDAPGVAAEQLSRLVRTAHSDCPFSRMAANGIHADVRTGSAEQVSSS